MNDSTSSTFQKLATFATIIFLCLFLITIFFLQKQTFSIDHLGNIHTSFDSYGDIPLHLTQISKFAFGSLFDTGDPIYYGSRLQYPFIINLLSGLLLRITHLWTFSILAPVIFFSIANCVLIFIVLKKILNKKSLALYGLCLFFLGSGLSFFVAPHVFHDIKTGNFMSVNVNIEPSLMNQSVDFPVPLTSALLFQRASIIGLFIFLIFLYLLLKLKENRNIGSTILLGIVFGIMPLIHMHTFIASSVVFSVFFITDLLTNKLLWKKLLLSLGISIILAVPQLLYLVPFSHVGQGFIHFRLGWMTEPSVRSIIFNDNTGNHPLRAFINFYFLNFGLLLPVAIVAVSAFFILLKRGKLYIKESSNSTILFCVVNVIALFSIIELIRFQPWDFDDNKIILYGYFFAVISVLWFYNCLKCQCPFLVRTFFIFFFIISTITGVADVISHLRMQGEGTPIIFTKDARDLALTIQSKVPPQELIITGTTHLNPVSSLSGRQVYVGYPGWLWTRGIDYSAREQEIKDFYRNPSSDDQIFTHFPATYVVVDRQVVNDYQASPEVFEKLFDLVYSNDEYMLFHISKK